MNDVLLQDKTWHRPSPQKRVQHHLQSEPDEMMIKLLNEEQVKVAAIHKHL